MRNESPENSVEHSPKSLDQMSTLYANDRGIIPRRNHLLILRRTEKPDVMMITAPWLNMQKKHITGEAKISGYNMFAKSLLRKNGGGVLLYLINGINAIKLRQTDVEKYDSLYVEIKHNNKRYILGSVYRFPKESAENDVKLCNEIKLQLKTKIQ